MNIASAPAAERHSWIELPLETLRRDGETQSRASLSCQVISDYTQLMSEGLEFPPVRACFDGSSYWLTDGFHRVTAAERLGHPKIRVDVFHGSINDARWDSYHVNAQHGLRRTPEDLMLVAKRAVLHERSAHLSNRELARHLQVSEKTIRRVRQTVSAAHAADKRIATRNGRAYVIHTCCNTPSGSPTRFPPLMPRA